MDKVREIRAIFVLINNFMEIAPIIEEFFRNENLKRQLLQIKQRILMLRLKQIKLRAIAATVSASIGNQRTWSDVEAQSFWELDCQHNSDEFFKNTFRMSRSSFAVLCESLPGLRKEDTNMRKAISLEKRIAIALYVLGSPEDYRTIGNLFGVGRSTVCQFVITFCREAWKHLWPIYLRKFPLTEEQIEEYVQGFEELGLPQCMGVISGSHIEVHPTPKEAADYYNNKGWCSTILLALVDAQNQFTYINVGSPGRCNASEIYEKSLLKKHLEQCDLLDEMSRSISKVNVPVFIVGDSAFRLSKTLMKPYPNQSLQSAREKSFNRKIAETRRVAKNTVDQLKARFRRIGSGIDNQKGYAGLIIKTCCALHNFLNERNDQIDEQWLVAQQAIDRRRKEPMRTEILDVDEHNAEEIREALALAASRFSVTANGFRDGNGSATSLGGELVEMEDASAASASASESTNSVARLDTATIRGRGNSMYVGDKGSDLTPSPSRSSAKRRKL